MKHRVKAKKTGMGANSDLYWIVVFTNSQPGFTLTPGWPCEKGPVIGITSECFVAAAAPSVPGRLQATARNFKDQNHPGQESFCSVVMQPASNVVPRKPPPNLQLLCDVLREGVCVHVQMSTLLKACTSSCDMEAKCELSCTSPVWNDSLDAKKF